MKSVRSCKHGVGAGCVRCSDELNELHETFIKTNDKHKREKRIKMFEATKQKGGDE